MLQLSKVAKSFGGQIVLREVSFQVNPGEKVGLIGANGTGKSTILKLIVGEVTPDSGSVACIPKTSAGYLSQVNQFDSGRTLHDELVGVFAEVNALEDRLRGLEAEMQHCLPAEPRYQALMDEYAEVTHNFEHADGYLVEARIGQVISGLGFKPEDAASPLEHFSGGWQMRVGLARLLLAQPGLLLLDEPTNHLDLRAIEWLENYLREYKGTVIIVSHDRYFLDKVTDRTLELASCMVTSYAGNYSFYSVEKQRRLEAQAGAYRRQQTEIAKQEDFINRFRAKATKASQVKSREKALDRLEQIEAPEEQKRGIKLRFPTAPPSGREAVTWKNMAKSYGDKVVFQGGELAVERGDRIAIVGPNGSGKSTLIRILAGLEQPSHGMVRFGHNTILSYFAQDQADALDASKTVVEEVYEVAPIEMTLTDVRAVLGRFLLSGDDVFKKTGQLSGGERSRVALAKMLLSPANFLLLDEPTNHLDLGSIEALEEALESFHGTALLVSHDRRFLDRVSTKVLEIDEGKMVLYLGNYTYYHDKKRALEIATAAAEQPKAKQPVKPQPTSKNSAANARRKAADLESRIAELESILAALEVEMAEPGLYQDYLRAAEMAKEYELIKDQVERLTEEWVAAHE